MVRGAWQVTVHGVTKSQTGLSAFHTHTHFPGPRAPRPPRVLTWSELTVMGSLSSSHTMHSSQGGVVKEPW